MGLAVLTAVFGMGTGVTPPVWSPEMYPNAGRSSTDRALEVSEVGRTSQHTVF